MHPNSNHQSESNDPEFVGMNVSKPSIPSNGICLSPLSTNLSSHDFTLANQNPELNPLLECQNNDRLTLIKKLNSMIDLLFETWTLALGRHCHPQKWPSCAMSHSFLPPMHAHHMRYAITPNTGKTSRSRRGRKVLNASNTQKSVTQSLACQSD
jgi:hypothetical protein